MTTFLSNILATLSSLAITFALLLLIFFPMERVFPAYAKQKVMRPHFWLDLAYFLGQYLLWTLLVYHLILGFNELFYENVSKHYVHYIDQLPLWIQVILTILLSDLLIYWFHRWQHQNSFLWRFHKIHHSAEHLDWLASFREHPIDTFFTILVINLPSILLGLNNQAIIIFVIFRGVWAIYIHSNVKLNLGPLKYLIGSPEIHHWHHYKDKDVGNYANLSPIMDLIFGTHYAPNHYPEELGIEEGIEQNYVKQLVEPLLPKKMVEKLRGKKGRPQ